MPGPRIVEPHATPAAARGPQQCPQPDHAIKRTDSKNDTEHKGSNTSEKSKRLKYAVLGSRAPVLDSAGTATSSSDTSSWQSLQAAVQRLLAAPKSISQTEALPSKPPSGRLAVFASNGLAGDERTGTGIHEAANALGRSYSQVTYDASNPATLQAALMNALAKKPAAVMVSAQPQSQFGTSTISAYAAAHVPLIQGSDAPVTLGDPIYGTPAGAASEERIGKALADWFIVDSKGQGKAIFETYTSAPILGVYRDAFIDEVKLHCPKCGVLVVPVTQSDLEADQLIPKVVNAARANPTYKYVFFDNGEFAEGVLAQLSAAGLSGLTVGGRSIDPYGEAALEAGTEQVWTGQSYYLEGEALVDVALHVVETGKGTSSDDVMPMQLLTRSNVSELDRGQFNLPSNSIEQYETVWHVPIKPCKLTCS